MQFDYMPRNNMIRTTACLLLAISMRLSSQESIVKTNNIPTLISPDAKISAVSSKDDIVVTISLVSHSPKPFPLLKWNLPEDGHFQGEIFEVSRNGKLLQYLGPMFKRRVTDDSYIMMEPGKVYHARLSLKEAYDVKPPGHYRIRYEAWNQVPEHNFDVIRSGTVQVSK